MTAFSPVEPVETAWCPGCGNHSIIESVEKALSNSGHKPHEILIVSGVGQAAKAPHYLRTNVFNGLHGRALPAASGAKLANPNLKVIVESGDGCIYGEGGNHFLAAVRRNIDLTLLVHNNQVYGLTKGQPSPTSKKGFISKATPAGASSNPLNPVLMAVAMRASFVARGFSGEKSQLTGLIEQAIAHPGFAIIDILTPCVSFNKVNTFAWYKNHVSELGENYDPRDWSKAMETADRFGETIPTGLIYLNEEIPPFEESIPALKNGPLAHQPVDRETLAGIVNSYY